MIVKHKGTFEVARTQQDTYQFLADPEAFSPLLPGFLGVEKGDDGSWRIRLRVGVSHLKGTAKVRLKLRKAVAPRQAIYEGTGTLLGGVVDLVAEFSLEPRGDQTLVNWTGEAQVAGRLAAMARGLLDPLARKNIQALIDAIKEALSQ